MKIAVIGTGKMGHVHAQNFKQVKGCKITACCDVDISSARRFAREFDVSNYYNKVEDLLAREENLDAVAVVTPYDTHADIIQQCLERGLAVFGEKPLGGSAAEAEKLAKLAKNKKCVNMVNLVHRGSPELQKAAELVKAHGIGRVMHVEASCLQSWLTSDYWGDWKQTNAFLWRLSEEHGSNGVVNDLGASLLDFVSYVAGDFKELRISTRSFNKGVRGNKLQGYNLDSTDSAVISADFKDGAMGAIHMTRWASGEKNSLRLRVYGDEGGLTLDIEESGAKLQVCSGADRHKAKWRQLKMSKVPSTWQLFVDAVKQDEWKAQPNFSHAAKLQGLLEQSVN
ncbi:MAG: Gfo/Idh/MocA family oxidoreductase [Lentisphaeraceae bacterium]|nr:Gfo/Idh/MocA family oxidoreductase [Lentisphaeraceae bacterium]